MSSLGSPAAASPLEDDDLLSEILLRLPPQPSSLPRASFVCKPWRCLVTDPRFFRRFELRHRRTPPLLGFFHNQGADDVSFFPTLEAPNRVPPGRFSLQNDNRPRLLGCRHGLALILLLKQPQFLVWDPVTGEQHHLAIPPWFDPAKVLATAAVLRSAARDVQVQQHFEVVLLAADDKDRRMLACVYSSETGVWGNLISTPNPSGVYVFQPAVLVENSLYWLFGTDTFLEILEFDLERQTLAVVKLPPGLDNLPQEVDISSELYLEDMCTVMRAEGGGMGFLFVSYYTAQAQLWKRKTDSAGVVSWELTRAIELDKLLSLNLKETRPIHVLGYAEYNNVLLLRTVFSTFMVQLESLKFKTFPRIGGWSYFLPFESVYTAGIGGGHAEAELLDNT
uniref:Uncharacterized protein n=1 Tax=Avena sativa TaxID=4498 RepID=A0ACD5WPK4_AVESA